MEKRTWFYEEPTCKGGVWVARATLGTTADDPGALVVTGFGRSKRRAEYERRALVRGVNNMRARGRDIGRELREVRALPVCGVCGQPTGCACLPF